MQKIPVIRYLTAAVLLVLFALSITPRKTLHDLLTHHRDQHISPHDYQTDHFHASGFDCKCDQLVAESPFVEQVHGFALAAITHPAAQQDYQLYHYYTTDCFFFSLRGPPVS